ncbi:MAG: cytochrome P450, partial [Aureispira sp.]|nr:cytochrome P450 [Aureispira sp.]
MTKATNKIPSPPRIPVFGNAHQVAGKDLVLKMLKVIGDYSPICEFKMINDKMLMISNHELAEGILNSPHCHKAIPKPLQQIRNFAKDGLFTAWTDEPNWKKAHNILMPGFGRTAIMGYLPIMVDRVNELMNYWRTNSAGQWVDVQNDMTKLTFEVIGRCGFDYSFGCFDGTEQHSFLGAMDFALNESFQRAMLPSVMHKMRVKKAKKYWKDIDFMFDLVDGIIQNRRANPDPSKIDFLNLMLHSKDAETGEYLDDENIRYQIITFLIAGHETTSGLLSFAFYELLRNKTYLKKAKTEAEEFLKNGTDDLTIKDMGRLTFIRKFLMETLRLHPPVFGFAMYADKDMVVDNYPVKKDQIINIISYYINRDKK